MNTEALPISSKDNVNKPGVYYFPLLQRDELDLGNVSDFPTVFQPSIAGVQYKLWKDIQGTPFLINGYPDDAYSAVVRVLASQAGKVFGLPCEETFFADIDGKIVTATAFRPAITVLENMAFEMYQLSANYDYQSNQKHAFYFLIQHWKAYATVKSKLKERFDLHYIDDQGNVYLSGHESATFLTPQLMSRALLVPLTIMDVNYRAIKDMVVRVGDKDITEIVFGSIPERYIDAHDEIAFSRNKHSFQARKNSFDTNWQKLLKALEIFENKSGGDNGI